MRGQEVQAERTRLLSEAIARAAPDVSESFACPYLPGREARQLVVLPEPLLPGIYHSLMDLNFRRLGPVFYRPACADCAECRMVRVPVDRFRASRAQRRCRERNRDVEVNWAPPAPTVEKQRLYARYLEARHDGQMDGSPEEYRRFLHASEVDTIEATYRLEGRIVAVAIADVEPLAMSAVYCYFEPDQSRRSLGVFNVLSMIDECRRRGLAHLYLGYYVADCGRMAYKARYRPCEVLAGDGRWTALA